MPLCGAYVLPVHRTHAALPGCGFWVPGRHAVQDRRFAVKPGRHAARAQAHKHGTCMLSKACRLASPLPSLMLDQSTGKAASTQLLPNSSQSTMTCHRQ